MTHRDSLLSRLWRKIARKKAQPEQPAPVKLSAQPAPLPQREPRRSWIEPLEGRIAPATLIAGGTGIIFTDADGDKVRVEFSAPILDLSDAQLDLLLPDIFKFDAGKAHRGDANATDDVNQQLRLIDLTALPTGAALDRAEGVSFTITAEEFNGDGDGLTNIGAIDATDLTLGSVTIDGDLGQIDVGRASAVAALKSLTVDSLGKVTTSQAGTATYESKITGALGSFSANEVTGGYLHVVDGVSSTATPAKAKGNVGSIVINEFLQSRDLMATATQDALIAVDGNITSVRIGTGLGPGGIIGGKGNDSGSVLAAGSIGSVYIDGDIAGGAGLNSGSISTANELGRVEVVGFLKGGDGDFSGSVRVGTKLGTAIVSKTVTSGQPVVSGIVAGVGDDSGVISAGSSIDSVFVLGDIKGVASIPTGATNFGSHAGGVSAGTVLKILTLQGSLTGGAGTTLSGFIEAGERMGTVLVNGNVDGGTGANSAVILSGGSAASITVAGHLAGGDGIFSGAIVAGQSGAGTLAKVRVANGILGGEGDSSGSISAFALGTVRVELIAGNHAAGAILGGEGNASGSIFAQAGAASITLSKHLVGGAGDRSASIDVGRLGSITVPQVLGGAGDGSGAILVHDVVSGARTTPGYLGSATIEIIKGGAGDASGQLAAEGGIGKVMLGNLFSGAGEESGRLRVGGGELSSANVASLKITNLGKAATGADPVFDGGTVQVLGTVANFNVGQVLGAKIGADRLGSFTAASLIDSVVTAKNAIGKFSIAGDVTNSNVLAGYSVDAAPVNGHAQIGAVTVGGNWSASNLVAGVRDLEHDGFGDADDSPIQSGGGAPFSKIASIVIKGTVSGTAEAGDRFGFVAQTLGSMHVNGRVISFDGAVSELTASTTDDVTARRIG